MGPICSTCVHSQIHLHYMSTIYSQSIQPFDHISHIWGIEGRLGFSQCPFPDESADVNQSWCQSVQPFDSFLRLLNVWLLQPPSAPPPCVSRGNLFGVYPFPDGSADVCQIWGQSFDSSPRLLNLWHPNPPPPEWLAQKHAKNNIYTSTIIIPAWTCRHQRH